MIGQGYAGSYSERYWNGTIDQVMVFNHSFSPEQVSLIFDETKNGYSNKSTIAASETDRGDSWYCNATSMDDYDVGITNMSNTVTIASYNPVVTSLVLNSTSSKNDTSGNISCWATSSNTG